MSENAREPKSRSPEDAYADIRKAVQRRFGTGAQLANIVAPTLGGSNRTVVFDLVLNGTARRLVSRQETYSGEDNPFLSPSHQFRIMRIVHQHGLPVPEPIFEYDADDGMGAGFVTEFVSGETMPKRIIGDAAFLEARSALPRQLGEFLARLDGIPTEEFAFLEPVADSVDPLSAQFGRYEAYAELHPALELAFRWLERHRPPETPRVLVHGDFRVGNFMVGQQGLVAVLDWECTHIGSRAEDFGWIGTRSWRFGNNHLPVGGLAGRQALIDGYRAAGGRPIDLETIRYWEIFGLMRWAVINIMQAHGHVFGGRRSPVFAACGRNAGLIEYDLLMTIAGHYE